MWRCIIALAHADGNVSAQEHEYIANVIANMDRVYGLTDEQRKTFEEDFKTPQKVPDLVRYINDPQVRGQLIYFGGLLAHKDGAVSPEEDSILKKLHADQMASLDMEQIRKDVRVHVANEMFKHDLAQSALRPQRGWYHLVDSLLLHMGIDVLEN